jgi:hypothetical protein
MALTTVLLRAVVIVLLSVAFVGVANALGISLALDHTELAVSAAIVAGGVLVYGKLLRMSSKRG